MSFSSSTGYYHLSGAPAAVNRCTHEFFPAEQDQRVETHQQAFVHRNVIGRALSQRLISLTTAPHHRPLATTRLIRQTLGSIDKRVVLHVIRR